MTETKPKGMTPAESWAWDMWPPGSLFRRAALWKYGSAGRAAEGVERAEVRATLPGEHGLECIFYEYIAARTVHLRKEVYVAWVVEGGEFRPGEFVGLALEHSPRAELQKYQMARGLLGGESAYGMGRTTRVTFVCYAPKGSGAAAKAIEAISDALKKLETVATWPEGKRSWFGMRHGRAWVKAASAGGSAYRPPADALPSRSGPPKPPKAPPGLAPASPRCWTKKVDALLRSWGHEDVADERRRERANRPPSKGARAAWARRQLEELEGQTDPFGLGRGDSWT